MCITFDTVRSPTLFQYKYGGSAGWSWESKILARGTHPRSSGPMLDRYITNGSTPMFRFGRSGARVYGDAFHSAREIRGKTSPLPKAPVTAASSIIRNGASASGPLPVVRKVSSTVAGARIIFGMRPYISLQIFPARARASASLPGFAGYGL